MIFKLTHINAAGVRHRGRVTARNLADAMDQAEQQWGAARAMACIRLRGRAALRLVRHRRPACV